MALKYVRCLENIGIRVTNLLIYYANALSFGIYTDYFVTMFYIIIWVYYIHYTMQYFYKKFQSIIYKYI